MTEIKVDNRFLYEGKDSGVIRYIGKLEGAKEADIDWVGVEWG